VFIQLAATAAAAIYPRAAVAAASSSSSNRVEITPKTHYKQKQNETHENIIH
jgi:hypothetical protein